MQNVYRAQLKTSLRQEDRIRVGAVSAQIGLASVDMRRTGGEDEDEGDWAI